MARKITRKSNKTSHVLSLLTTDPKRSEPVVEPSAEPSFELDTASNSESTISQPTPMVDLPATENTETITSAPAAESDLPEFAEAPAAPAPQRHAASLKPSASTSTVDLAQALEERISQQIHDSLCAKLAEDEAAEAQRAEQERKISERIAAEAGVVLESEKTASEEPQTEADKSIVTLESSASNQETSPAPKAPSEQHFELVNIMDVMLDRFQQEFMDKFGICTCHRCWLDTRALTLSSVPAKYVVLSHDTVGAMLNFYEHRYRGMLMAQLTQACMTVMQNPHH